MNRHAGYFSLVICRGSMAIFEYANYEVLAWVLRGARSINSSQTAEQSAHIGCS